MADHNRYKTSGLLLHGATIKTFYTGHKNDKMASDQIKISTENDKSYGTTTVKPAAKTTEVEVKGIDRLK